MHKQQVLAHIEEFCSHMSSFLNNDNFLLVDHDENPITIVQSKFVNNEICADAHTYLEALSLSNPWSLLIRQFIEEQNEYIGTVCIACAAFINWDCLFFTCL
jgi:hypothetical protein